MTGGPDRDTNISDDVCFTVNRVRKGLQIMFILLNPLSQAAVLTGIVLITDFNFKSSFEIIEPLLSLKSLEANFKSLNERPNFAHRNFKSLSPNSGESSLGNSE